MVEITTKHKVIIVVGMRGTGKTEFAKSVIRSHTHPFVYDTLSEYHEWDRYIPENNGDVVEMEAACSTYIIPRMKSGEIDLYVHDELNRHAPPKPTPLTPSIRDINDFVRHWPSGFIGIARKPVQLNNDLVDLCDYLIVFRLRGANDMRYLKDINPELVDVMTTLDMYHYILINPDRSFHVCTPVVIQNEKGSID